MSHNSVAIVVQAISSWNPYCVFPVHDLSVFLLSKCPQSSFVVSHLFSWLTCARLMMQSTQSCMVRRYLTYVQMLARCLHHMFCWRIEASKHLSVPGHHVARSIRLAALCGIVSTSRTFILGVRHVLLQDRIDFQQRQAGGCARPHRNSDRPVCE